MKFFILVICLKNIIKIQFIDFYSDYKLSFYSFFQMLTFLIKTSSLIMYNFLKRAEQYSRNVLLSLHQKARGIIVIYYMITNVCSSLKQIQHRRKP